MVNQGQRGALRQINEGFRHLPLVVACPSVAMLQRRANDHGTAAGISNDFYGLNDFNAFCGFNDFYVLNDFFDLTYLVPSSTSHWHNSQTTSPVCDMFYGIKPL